MTDLSEMKRLAEALRARIGIKQMTIITYATFFNLTPHGPRFISHVYENGKAFPIYFQGDTDTQSLERAQKWANENALTPERQARIAANRAARVERLRKSRSENNNHD